MMMMMMMMMMMSKYLKQARQGGQTGEAKLLVDFLWRGTKVASQLFSTIDKESQSKAKQNKGKQSKKTKQSGIISRLEICRDRRDRRSCKNSSNCVNFSWKQRIFLQNLHINMKFTHLFVKFAHPFLFQLLKFNIFISINHLYWNLAALFLAKLVPIYAFLVCKTFGTKIRSCKFFDKFQVCQSWDLSRPSRLAVV